MKKPIFLEVINAEGTTSFFAKKGQTYKDEGTEFSVSTKTVCVHKDQSMALEEGEIWATDGIYERKQGFYSISGELFQITNDIGVLLTGDEVIDQTHEQLILAYRAYCEGKELSIPEEEVRKPKGVTLLDKLRGAKNLKPPTIENDGWYVDEGLWYFLMRSVSKRKNILLTGNSGSGKTDLVTFIAEKLQKELGVFDMAVSNPYKTFCGNLRADNGTTSFQLARFATQIQRPGIVLMDELSRAAPSANNIFLPVLDKRRTLYIEDAIIESERQIPIHDECMLWATANIGSEFIGTNMLDRALMNRFQPVGVEYPPVAKEIEVLMKRCDLSRTMASKLVSVADAVRKMEDLSKDISTRQLIEVAELVFDGYDPVKAFEWSVLNQYEGSKEDGGEKATFMAVLQSM